MRFSLFALTVLSLAACSSGHSSSGTGGSSAGAGTSGGGSGSGSNGATTGDGSSGGTSASSGTSAACAGQGDPCMPTNVCDTGVITCVAGAPVCKDQGLPNPAQTGATCGPLATCQGTQCLQANWPVMPNNDGGVIAQPNLVLMTYSDDANANNLDHDAEWVVDGGYLSLVAAQYGVGSGSWQLVGLGKASTAPTGTNTNYNAFPNYFQQLFDAGTLPPYQQNDFYVLYLPASWADTSGFCQSYGGYHTYYPDNFGNNIPYAIIPNCQGDQQGYLQEIEFAATHEIVEGTTDPQADSWVFLDPNSPSTYIGGEVADMCENYDAFYLSPDSGIYVAPTIWSNTAIAAGQVPCQPWAAGTAYVSVLAPTTMATALPGTSVGVTVTGWASAPYPTWGLAAIDNPISYADYSTNPSLSSATIGPGQQVTVTLSVPAGAMGGQHGAVWVACSDLSTQQNLGAAMVGVTAGCAESSRCLDPQTVCLGDGGSVGYCGENPCAVGAASFTTCSAQGTNDGVCLPNDFGAGPVELCSQAGSLPSGATGCSQGGRTGDGGVESYCDPTSFCFGYNTPTCLPLCTPDGGAGSCSAGDDCVEMDQYYGVCLPDCTTGQSCPGSESCYPIGSPGSPQSACLP